MGLPIALLALIGAVMVPGLVRSVQAQIELDRKLSQAEAMPLTEPPSPADTAPPADQDRVKVDILAWLADGGRGHILALGHDLTTVGDGTDRDGYASLRRACAAMTAHMRAAQRYRPFPDAAGQTSWQAVLSHFAAFGAICQRPSTYRDKAAAVRCLQELDAATAAFEHFNRRLEHLTGQRPKTGVARA